MPDGNTSLISLVWQPLQGAEEARIYPLIRKLDTVSSNSYLISTPDVLLLIDPGGLPDQAGHLGQVIEECRRKQERPVFVFLTHAHIDHFIGVLDAPAFAHPEAAVFVVEDRGSAALERGDTELTQADLFERDLPPMKVGMHLFPRAWEADAGIPVSEAFPNGATVTITYTREDGGLPCARLSFGNGPHLTIWSTPGHSPDSICLRMGNLLFIGDLLFASTPGIAGICGWDQKALVQSTSGMQAVTSGSGISLVCPGHGRVVSAPDATRMLSAVRSDALALPEIAELNRDRANHAAAFGEDCMEKVNELFTVMAGRLYYVSYVMEELGESDIAERMDALIPGDTIDELLDAFAAFAGEHHRAGNVSIHLALKAGQVIAKLERAFKKEELARIIDPMLVERSGRLLAEYMAMLRGFSIPGNITGQAIAPLVEATITGLSVPYCSDEDLLASADDDASFIRILLSRIGTRPLLEDVAFSLSAEDRSVTAPVDPALFADLLIYILEDLVGTGSDCIAVSVQRNDPRVLIIISGNRSTGIDGTGKKMRFLSGLCERAGGILSCAGERERPEYVITLGPA